jgi:PAS domain S-box-containing protein
MKIDGGRAPLQEWFTPFESRPARYAAALGAVGFAVAVQLLIRPIIASPFIVAFGAVAFCACFCGLGPSLLVIAITGVAAALFFMPVLTIAAPSPLLAILAFAAVSLFIVLLGKRAQDALTAQRQLSSALQATEARWRSLADAIPQIVWTADAKGAVDYANQRWLEYVGITIAEARLQGWPNTVHPDDVDAVLGRWKEATRNGAPYEVESRLKRGADGAFHWFLSRGHPVRDESGQVVKWFGTSTDIDDQKRATERARFLAEASRELASSLDYEATLQSVTRAAIPHFADWASVNLLSDNGQIQQVAVAHSDPRKVQLAHELARKYPVNPNDPVGVPNVLRTGKAELLPQIPDELLVRLIPDQELLRVIRELHLRSSLVAPIIARGKTLGAISFIMAESNRRHTEDDLALAEELGRRAGGALDNARLYRDLQAASRLKDEFVSTVSHELRTPLTAILGWTHILGSSPPSQEKLARGVSVIERNAKAQAQLIDDLLDLSRVVTGKMRLAVREMSAIEVVAAALETVRPSAEAKSIRLQSVLDPDAGPLLGDPDRLQQIVWNLLSNAVKFTPKGGRVQVRLLRVQSQVEIEVVDTGEGIAKEFLPHVFERFVQADSSVSRAHGGLGLGLAIAKHLTELHGGTLEASSPGLGQGATFSVKIPLSAMRAASAGDGHPAVSGRTAPPRSPENALRGAAVLVVEDAQDARELLVEVLREAGAQVKAVSNVPEALAVLSNSVLDLLVSDIGMPGADGYSLIREVRKHHAALPAVALTAYARGEDRAKAITEGFDVHLPKPVDPGELIGVASALLRRRASR